MRYGNKPRPKLLHCTCVPPHVPTPHHAPLTPYTGSSCFTHTPHHAVPPSPDHPRLPHSTTLHRTSVTPLPLLNAASCLCHCVKPPPVRRNSAPQPLQQLQPTGSQRSTPASPVRYNLACCRACHRRAAPNQVHGAQRSHHDTGRANSAGFPAQNIYAAAASRLPGVPAHGRRCPKSTKPRET